MRFLLKFTLCLGLFCLGASAPLWAHFQLLVPETDLVETGSGQELELLLGFFHPMGGGPVMPMAQPREFGVLLKGKKTDLLPQLLPTKLAGQAAFFARIQLKRPGDHLFYVIPAPYWDEADQVMITQYTKVVVNAFGEQEGWQKPVGLPFELVPLNRPYGLWTGNLVRALVLKDGKPLAHAKVEVEYWNQGGQVKPPKEALYSQTIYADSQGVIAYAMPKAGWWGFVALETDQQMLKNPQGKLVPHELGAVLWVFTQDMD